jgi:dUTP pyrophosphatase
MLILLTIGIIWLLYMVPNKFIGGLYMEARTNDLEEKVIGYLELRNETIEVIPSNNQLYYVSNLPIGKTIAQIVRGKLIKFLGLDDYIREVVNRPVPIYVEPRDESIKIPAYANDGDSGMDIRAADDDIILEPGKTIIVHTGISVTIPEGYEIQVRPRSGISSKINLRVANAPGTVDSTYTDDVGVIVWNASNENTGTFEIGAKGNPQGTYIIRKDDRIAQIVLAPVAKAMVIPVGKGRVKEIKKESKRHGGFGSTGIN